MLTWPRNLLLQSFGAILIGAVACSISASAHEVAGTAPAVSSQKPAELENVGIDEKTGTQIDMGLQFKDETGKVVKLGDYFDGTHPVIISPVYFNCPGLCNYHLNGLTDALKGVDWSPGQKFQIVAMSFDSKETPEVAAKKKENYVKAYGRVETADGWHFLTGDEKAIRTFTDSVGFKFKWNPQSEDWIHSSAAIVISPDGKVSRYLPGIYFESKDVKLALNEATEGKIGGFVESLVLYCFRYNPHQSRYVLYADNLMKLGGLLVIFILAILLIPTWLKSRREKEA